MSGRLTDRFTGDGRTSGAMRDTFLGHEQSQGVPDGAALDGARYGLQGQPPRARMGNWGYIGWIYGWVPRGLMSGTGHDASSG